MTLPYLSFPTPQKNRLKDLSRRVIEHNGYPLTHGSFSFLEIGSWCGDSSIIFANILKQFGGKLYCLDWWKGSEGEYLYDVAQKKDIFSIFWNRIIENNLQDTVIPLRGRSEDILKILKPNSFDLVFIDGDHRYEGTKSDIGLAIPLVKETGILSGHDCSGYIEDFDMEVLQEGKDLATFDTIFCGVVLAVGERFKNFELSETIWSIPKKKIKRRK